MVFVQKGVVKHNYSLSHELLSNLHSSIQTDLIILDFSKAFDKVPHKKLLWKLNNYGIRGNTWKWVSDFLSNRMQQVALDGEVSGQLPVVRDRPFNLKWGGGGGGYGFLFRPEFFFRTTRELKYLFILSRKARNFFPEIYIRLYDKNSESDYFFFPPPKSEYFFQQHWESEYFFR